MRLAACIAIALFALPGHLRAAPPETPSEPAAGADAAYARLVENAIGGYVLPAYDALQGKTRDLAAEIEGFCAAPSPDARDALARAFGDVLKAWAGVDFLRFGPMAQGGRYERFAYWPDVHGTGARQLRRVLSSGDADLLKPGAIARQSAAVQGLPALETLLFSGERALLAGGAPEVFRCGLAGAIAANLETIAAEAVAGWQGENGWTALIERPGEDNPVYRTHAEAATEILKAILTEVEQMRDQRLVPPVGPTPQDAKASRAPYFRSGETMAYIRAGTDALQRFITASGFLDLLPPDRKVHADSVRSEFAAIDRALDAAGPDIEAALADRARRSQVIAVAVALGRLRELFEHQIAVAAGLTPGFNSLDGD